MVVPPSSSTEQHPRGESTRHHHHGRVSFLPSLPFDLYFVGFSSGRTVGTAKLGRIRLTRRDSSLKRHRPPLSNVARGGGEGWRPPRRHREDERRRSWSRDGKTGETKRKEDANEKEKEKEKEGGNGGSRRRKEEEEQEPRRYERKHGAGERGIERGAENEERERETVVRASNRDGEKRERERQRVTRKKEARRRNEA